MIPQARLKASQGSQCGRRAVRTSDPSWQHRSIVPDRGRVGSVRVGKRPGGANGARLAAGELVFNK